MKNNPNEFVDVPNLLNKSGMTSSKETMTDLYKKNNKAMSWYNKNANTPMTKIARSAAASSTGRKGK
jgi:hypothetical protein